MISFLVLVVSLVSVFPQKATPPDSVSLQYCYRLAYKNYPTADNLDIQKKITHLNVDIARSGYFPQINVNGKASYQSEVSTFSTPNGGGPPPISKDQYEAGVDVTQTIFNAGAVGYQKALARAKGRKQRASTRVDLHKIRSQIDQVYYGILLSMQQKKTIALLEKNLRTQFKTVHSRVKNGVLLPGQQHILKAQLIKSRQDSAETQSNIEAGYEVLSELIGQKINPNTNLELPQTNPNYRSLQPKRAEYELFKQTRQTLDQQAKLAGTQKWPKLSAFGTAAYGRPGLDFLNNDFHDYYIVGLRLKWSLWGAVNAGRKQQALHLQQKMVRQNKRAFSRQLDASLDRIHKRIASIREKMQRDQKIINLRKKIVNESASQLKNGVITATEYIDELTKANQARLSKYLHRVQLSQAQRHYLTALGRPITE